MLPPILISWVRKMSVIQGTCPVSLNLLMVENTLEPKGMCIVVSLGVVPGHCCHHHCLSCCLSTCSLKGWAQLLSCVSTQLASLTTSWKYFTKQQWSRSRWILLLSPLPPPLFFKKHHHTYTYVILVFYGLKITHSRGGVSCAVRHTASRKSLPTCVCAPSVPRPPPQAYTTTSTTTGGLTVDTISAATTS